MECVVSSAFRVSAEAHANRGQRKGHTSVTLAGSRPLVKLGRRSKVARVQLSFFILLWLIRYHERCGTEEGALVEEEEAGEEARRRRGGREGDGGGLREVSDGSEKRYYILIIVSTKYGLGLEGQI